MKLPRDPCENPDDFAGCRGFVLGFLLVLAAIVIAPHIGAALAWIGGLIR
jgi:hypothetical protein